MNKKWIKTDPATLKVGDKVKAVKPKLTIKGIVTGDLEYTIPVSGIYLNPSVFTWYVRSDEPTKPDSGLVEGHDAAHWHKRFLKLLAHNEQIQRSATARTEKLKRLEGELENANLTIQHWESNDAALAASTNETQAQLDDAMLTIAEKNTELANLRKVLAQAQNSNSPSNVIPLAAFYRPYRTRPDEPPVGTFFRVDRTGFEFWRFASMEDGYGYWQISPRSEEPDWERWDDITEPGDTITRLLLVEATDD